MSPPDPAPAAEPSSAKIRSALKRVGSKAAASDQTDQASTQRRRGQRSAQAALGMMDKPPAAQDDAALKDWLDGLPQTQKEKLARLIGQARPAAESTAAAPPSAQDGLSRVERHLERHGINFDFEAKTVIVNIGANEREAAPRPSANPRNDWGRQWGRVKDFINGH